MKPLPWQNRTLFSVNNCLLD